MGIGETRGDSGSDRPGFKSSLSLDFPRNKTLRSMRKYSIREVKRIKRKGDGGRRQPREAELSSK